MPGTPFFTWPAIFVKQFLGLPGKELLFIPFAAVTLSWNDYEEKVKEVFNALGFQIKGIHHFRDKKLAVEQAGGIVVGGGNTFTLSAAMHNELLFEIVRKKVLEGTPYVGWSAGANLGCPTIMTTNDMPVTQIPTFEALNLIPFQINPHYHELKFEGQGGETRKERLEEFLVMNPAKKVIGLPEGMLLHRQGEKLMLRGEGIAKLYEFNKPIKDLRSDDDLSYLLN